MYKLIKAWLFVFALENIYEDTLEIPQSQNTDFLKKGKKKSPGSDTITCRILSLTSRGREKKHKPTDAKQTNARKAHRPALFPKPGDRNAKQTEKHKDKMQSKTKYKPPSRINHKATQCKSNTRTTALKWSVV